MKESWFTDSQLMAVLQDADVTVPARFGTHGMRTAPFYNWQTKFGGMEVPSITRPKELDDENPQLRKMYAEAQRSTDLLRKALATKW